MKFGVSISSYSSPWEDIRDSIISMDAGRWNSVWCPDHFIPPAAWKGAEDQPMFEAWTLMAAAAGMTNKIRLGHMVSGNTYRNPALVANALLLEAESRALLSGVVELVALSAQSGLTRDLSYAALGRLKAMCVMSCTWFGVGSLRRCCLLRHRTRDF